MLSFRSIKNKQTLTVFGDGNQTRDFTHVLDVAASNLLAMKAKVNSGTNTIVNIGASKETSVNQIAKMIGGDIEYIIPNPREKYEELRKMADNNLAKKLLKWVPQVDITEGISKLAPAA